MLALTDCENLQSSHLAVLRWLQQLKSLDLSRCARVDAFGMRHLTHLTSLSALSLQVRAVQHLYPITFTAMPSDAEQSNRNNVAPEFVVL